MSSKFDSTRFILMMNILQIFKIIFVVWVNICIEKNKKIYKWLINKFRLKLNCN